MENRLKGKSPDHIVSLGIAMYRKVTRFVRQLSIEII